MQRFVGLRLYKHVEIDGINGGVVTFLGPKIKMRHKTVPNYMPARGQDIGLSRNTFSKKDWHMDIVLLHLGT